VYFDLSKMSTKDEDGAVSQDDKKNLLFCLNRGNVLHSLLYKCYLSYYSPYPKTNLANYLRYSMAGNITRVLLESKRQKYMYLKTDSDLTKLS